MTTLAVMKSRIANELSRSDLTSEIATAISDAIAIHERERFWFNESRDKTFSTVAAQRVYTTSDASWISDIIEIDDLFVTVSGRQIRMDKADPTELELLSTSTTTGYPYLWAYLNSTIILYPTPDAIYTVRGVGHVRLTTLSGDSDSNAWTTQAEALIRQTAKASLYAELLRDMEGAQVQSLLIQTTLERLRAETSRRKTVGQIVPTHF